MQPLVSGTILRLSARLYLENGTSVISESQLAASDVRVVLRLRANNHASNNFVWSTAGGGAWVIESTPPTLPIATAPTAFARWTYNVPADVLTAKLGTPNPDFGDDWAIEVDFLDDPTMAANETVVGSLDLIAQRDSLSEISRKVDRNADLTESQRGDHTWQNEIVHYVSPNVGTTELLGASGSRDNPFDNLDDAIEAASTSEHPVICLVADAVGATTVLEVTSTINLDKRYLFIRGPGRDFIVRRTNNGDVFNISSDGVELSGFQIETATTGSGRGIEIDAADYVLLKELWINSTRGDAIRVTDSTWAQIFECTIDTTGLTGAGHGITINNSAEEQHIFIIDCHFFNVSGDAIRATMGAVQHCQFERNIIHQSTGVGINLGANSSNNIVLDNALRNNAGGDIIDLGTDNLRENNEQWAKDSEIAPISLDSGVATLGGMLAKLADDAAGGNFDATTDSLRAIASTAAAILIDTTEGGPGPWTSVALPGPGAQFSDPTGGP